ncbi:hypothetical protein BCY92_16840 [Bacillus wiedmannii]|uniref:hypothetical protein n=1 Tax=Bacillus wiedmannii TaxID=1890302 RepID=UPI000E760AD5|nr:hypothetical protein BCY92_16840 [Bacillus wiedmannii]
MISQTRGLLFGLKFQKEDLDEVESYLNERYRSPKGTFICEGIRELLEERSQDGNLIILQTISNAMLAAVWGDYALIINRKKNNRVIVRRSDLGFIKDGLFMNLI